MRRVIFLVDMNAFFISCETARAPELAGRPAAVAGDPKRRSGIILAANYEARAFGVKTTMTIYEAQKRCPSITLLPPDRRLYEQNSRAVMKLLGDYTPVIEQNSIDEAWLDMTGCEGLFGQPAETAREIMGRIDRELRLWCSIGISENKFLAKMASEMKKPQGITELWVEKIEEKLWPLPVSDMYGVGRRMSAKLHESGFHTIGDVARYGREVLPKRYGKYGAEIYRLANGIDPAAVVPHEAGEMKSIGRSTTLPQNITELAPAKEVLAGLAEEVGADARRHGKKASTVQITLKYEDFTSITRQQTVPPTNLTRKITAAAVELLCKNWSNRPVRLLGITVSGFERNAEETQISFFETASSDPKEKKEELIEKTVDSIRERFGKDTLRRAAALKKKTETDGEAER